MNEISIENVAAKIVELQAKRDELDEAIKHLRSTLAENIEEGDSVAGDFKFRKYTNKRFDDALARKVLTPEQYESVAVLKADSKRASALLDEELLDQCKKEFGSVVKITLRD